MKTLTDSWAPQEEFRVGCWVTVMLGDGRASVAQCGFHAVSTHRDAYVGGWCGSDQES
jgi:hypothetical protein